MLGISLPRRFSRSSTIIEARTLKQLQTTSHTISARFKLALPALSTKRDSPVSHTRNHVRRKATTHGPSPPTSRPRQRKSTSRSTISLPPQNGCSVLTLLPHRNSTSIASNAASPDPAHHSHQANRRATHIVWRSTCPRGTRCRNNTWDMCRKEWGVDRGLEVCEEGCGTAVGCIDGMG